MPDLSGVLELLERQRRDDWHEGAQIYVSLRGEVLLDTAMGESRPGRALRSDDLMLWYSAGKSLTVVAILQLWEQGRIGLDDRIGDYIDDWGAGKERCTLRHVLTHTGGFPGAGYKIFDADLTYEEEVAWIAAWRAEWEPGTAAAYHPSSSWKILGAIVERIDGRPIDRYVRDEVCAPLGLEDVWMGIPEDEQPALGERRTPVYWKGHAMPVHDDDGFRMAPYRVDELHNEPWHVAKVEPGGGMRGPARQLGRFYESLLGLGSARVIEPRTVELMGAVHRYGIKDGLLRMNIPWGLGVQRVFSGGASRRAFGHNGMASSRGFADPETGLVLVLVTNGLPSFLPAEERLFQVTDAVYSALGDDVALVRTEVKPPREVFGFSG
jgi:CubicO group peptidase (beta-lactamase class C family)